MDKLKNRIDSFSDGVIAIIITIMILNIAPVTHDSWQNYLLLGKQLGIYLISFIFVANMWYQHGLIFGDLKKLTYRIVILNMIFLAALSLTPLFTNMMASNTTSVTVMLYGLVQFIVNSIFAILGRSVALLKYTDEKTVFSLYQKIYGSANMKLRILSVVAFVVAYFAPHIAIIFYLAYPILMFLLNSAAVRRMSGVITLPTDQQKEFIQLSDADKNKFFEERGKMLTQSRQDIFSTYSPNLSSWLDQGADIKSSQQFRDYLAKNTTPEQQEQIKEWLKNRQKKSVK